MKINVIDLFAGCGGLIEGFLQTGKYKTLATVDWEASTIQTLKKRLSTKWNYDLKKQNIIQFDIQRTEELINGFDDDKYGFCIGLDKIIGKNQVDLVIGGPPCQAYSIAGRVKDEKGMQDDYRNFLFESYVKLVEYYKPQAFVFENVEGILSAKPGGLSILKRIKKTFNKIGYEITNNLRENGLFDTSFYNVPQKRKRVIIFGVPKNKESTAKINSFYSKMKFNALSKPLNSKSAFENLPKIFPDQKLLPRQSHSIQKNSLSPVMNHEPRFHNKRDVEIFKLLAEDIKSGREQYISSKALRVLYKQTTGKESNFHKYNVIRENNPSNTIPAHLYKDGLRHIHPDPKQARSITVREAARLQTFDDDFEFLGSKGEQYKMIGNAVPPSFSKIIAEGVYNILIYKLQNIESPSKQEIKIID